jgi:hypothetical protein
MVFGDDLLASSARSTSITYQQGLAACLAAFIVWMTVYALMIRRGVKDRSYGMPIFALSLNIMWEAWMGFASEMELLQRSFCVAWFVGDLGVLYTVFKYGAEDFKDWPLLHRWFKPAVCGILFMSWAMNYAVIKGLNDTHGAYSATLTIVVYAALLVVMILRRNSVKGQSLYIALLILIGDVLGSVVMIFGMNYFQPGVSMHYFWGFQPLILCLHVLYIGLYCHVAIRDGINPFTRL